jgi:hypothetical protein
VSGKVVLISGTVALLAAGTGISLAATQSNSGSSVTCIVLADAKAAVDANSALSDHFPVGTALHLTSAGRQVDVTVSGPITAAAPTTAAPAPSDSATAQPSDTATAQPTDTATADPSDTATAQPSDTATADPTATATTSAPAGGNGGNTGGNNGGKNNHHKPPRRGHTTKPAAKPTASASASESNAQKVAKVAKVSVKADDNQGVDANSVCVELSKNAFNTLGNVGNGNNVGAFIATMTVAQGGQAGGGAGNGGQASSGAGNGGQASSGAGNGGQTGNGQAGASASASPSASATAPAGNDPKGGNTQHHRGQNHR